MQYIYFNTIKEPVDCEKLESKGSVLKGLGTSSCLNSMPSMETKNLTKHLGKSKDWIIRYSTYMHEYDMRAYWADRNNKLWKAKDANL